MGLPPAQIAPFLVYRLGLSKARRLALTGASLKAEQALHEGLVDICVATEALEETIQQQCRLFLRCGPKATETTKKIIMSVGQIPHDELLDYAADEFARSARSKEGMEGMMSFVQKRTPSWAVEES